LALGAAESLAGLADQLPVEMVLELGDRHALAGDELRGSGIAALVRLFHVPQQAHTHLANDGSPGALLLGIELQGGKDVVQNLHVGFRFLLVLFPLFLQVFVLHALQRRLVDLDATHLVLERLQQEFLQLLGFHCASGVGSPRQQSACRYSITRSAAFRTSRGTVRPSALALRLLTMSSKRPACSTGVSAGLAPRRTRSASDALRRSVSVTSGP